MNGHLALVILTLFITFILALGITAFSWQRRHAGIWAYPFAFTSLAAAWWVAFYAFELLSVSLERKLLWAQIEYIAIVSMPVLWFLFAMAYTERQKWLSRSRIFALFIIPLITLLLVLTNAFHHLIWADVALNVSGIFPTFDPNYGAWFWLHSGYSYLLLLFGTLALIQAAIRSPKRYRWQNIALIMGALIPWIANAVYLLDLGGIFSIDLSPILFVLSGLVLAWSIFRIQLFDMVPVARRVAVDSMQGGMIVLDAKSRILDMNPAALEVFGRQLVDVIGLPIDALLVDWPELVDSFKDMLAVKTEVRLKRENEEQYFELQIAPLLNSGKRVNGRLVVFHDITSYKQTEAVLTEARDQAVAVSRVKTELLARVSHELRTPLNVILGFSEMLQLGIPGPVNERQYGIIEKILESTHFLTDQVNDLLNLSSIEAGTIMLHRYTFFIMDVIDEVMAKYQEEASNKSLQLVKVESDTTLKMVYGDRDGVMQILMNLVGNALKFSDKGVVQISVFAYDDHFWALQVVDEGPGIPPQAHDLIFEPFRQIDGSMTRIHGGTGLGLAIVKQMTELMGGTVKLKSDVGQGSTFTVLLPNEVTNQNGSSGISNG